MTTAKDANKHIIKQEAMATYLTKLKYLTYLEPFLGKTNCVADAAKAVDVPANKMLYHVRKMLKLNILKLEHTKDRRGRRVDFYRSCADELFIPVEATPLSNLEDYFKEASTALLEEQVEASAKALKQANGKLGFWIHYDAPSNATIFRLTKEETFANSSQNADTLGTLPTVMSLGRIKLKPKKAERVKELLAELHSLEEDEEGDYYFYRFAFTPLA